MPSTLNRTFLALLLITLAFALFVSARRRPVSRTDPDPQLHLDINRSFAITDPAILDGFSFERVMNALVEGTTLTATQLYRQWFDTQNPRPGLAVADAPHCDDFLINGQPAFNGFSRRCPTPEGVQATFEPFVPPSYIPLALINRFDLTPADGSNCGQYRMIFALTEKKSPLDKIHLIFEAVLPNPNRSAGLAGCRPIAQFWADLSRVDSIYERRAQLERFFFDGIAGFPPVVHPDHYRTASGGSIRTLQYTFSLSGHAGPRFYQFRLEKECNGDGCRPILQPDALENMPVADLFDGRNDTAVARRFREEFIRQVPTLALRDVNGFFMNISREFLTGESDSFEGAPVFSYLVEFLSGLGSPEGQEFHQDIRSELRRIGSNLTPAHIVNRAETQSCNGCHVVNGPIGEGLSWPEPVFYFQHVSEDFREPGEAGPRFSISPAMRNVFIPHRMDILRQFLDSGTPPVHSNADALSAAQELGMTIGGGRRVQ